jgi:hypothetical protein
MSLEKLKRVLKVCADAAIVVAMQSIAMMEAVLPSPEFCTLSFLELR